MVYPSVGSSAPTPSTISTQSDTGTKAPSTIPETQTQLSNEIPPVKPAGPSGVQAPEAVEEDTNSIATGGSTSATTASPVSTPGTASPATSETTLTTEGQTESSVPSVTTQEIQTTAANTTTGSTTSANNGTDSITTSTETPTTTELLPGAELLNMTNYREVCGRRLVPTSRIVGGAKSTFGKWPWQISLRQWRTSTYLHKCGAALLNENWAITAAHCVDNVPPGDLLLRLGEHDLSTETEPLGHLERRVQLVASHPQFDPRTFEYDLALLRFYEPVTPFAANVLPICVPEDDRSFVGSTAYVTGWGRLYEDGPLPSVLQEVRVPVINNSACEGMYRSAGYVEHIPSIFICAGWKKGGFDSCEGDSGGPMVIQRAEDMRWVLAGVISWGIGCAEPNQPGVYTRISEFRGWINQILQF
ncbi:serine proteinase stubble [Hetaerina americana]|uniref:serine proteinase stubble n=1 Tax=Hetaerina americana TaxID=62018 RepID=UPI003A7F2F83